jgi:hypothetical protein
MLKLSQNDVNAESKLLGLWIILMPSTVVCQVYYLRGKKQKVPVLPRRFEMVLMLTSL